MTIDLSYVKCVNLSFKYNNFTVSLLGYVNWF